MTIRSRNGRTMMRSSFKTHSRTGVAGVDQREPPASAASGGSASLRLQPHPGFETASKISCGLAGFCAMAVSVCAIVITGCRPTAAGVVRTLEIQSGRVLTAVEGGKIDSDAEDRKKENRRTVKIGVYVVCGIAAAGLAVVFFVVTWGRIARNRGRLHAPAKKPFDPLWYLKKPPTADSSSTGDAMPPRNGDEEQAEGKEAG